MIAIGCDHGALELKEQLIEHLIGRIFGALPHEKTYNGRIIFYKGDRR